MNTHVGKVMNARELCGGWVQGRVLHVGRRGYGPLARERVAVLLDVRRGAYPRCFVCSPGSLRAPPKYESVICEAETKGSEL